MQNAPRISVFTTSYPIVNLNDAGHFVESECKTLSKKGLQLHVLAPGHPKATGSTLQSDIAITRFPYFFKKFQRVAYGSGIPANLKNSLLAKFQVVFFMLSFLFYARRINRGTDIIHCHWFPAGLIGALTKGKNQKLVLMMHHPHKKNFIFKWILKKADWVFSNSRYTQEATNKIFPVENHEILHLGIDMNAFTPAKQSKDDGVFSVLFVGRLIEWKGVEFLIRAFELFTQKAKDVKTKLRIVGDGPLKKELEELTQKLNCADQIVFEGYVERRNIVSFYQHASLFCIPSILLENGDTEGLGLTTIEACACEIPVIGSNIGGITDVIVDGENGFLVRPGNIEDIADKLHELYRDQDLRSRMGKRGRALIQKKFSLDANAEKIIAAYQTLMK